MSDMNGDGLAESEFRVIAMMMAHDLRNMFSVMTGMAVLLEHRHDSRYVEIMKKQLELSEQIVTSFVKFADEGRLRCRTFELRPVVAEILESMDLPSTLTLRILNDEPIVAHADPGHVRQILWNLIHNAVDACGRDSAEISIRIYNSSGRACAAVRDTGPGIPPEIQDILMQTTLSTKTHGLGLGLYLSRRIAEFNGGHLVCIPGLERGAEFVLSLPVPQES